MHTAEERGGWRLLVVRVGVRVPGGRGMMELVRIGGRGGVVELTVHDFHSVV